jgi:hypothetical protein
MNNVAFSLWCIIPDQHKDNPGMTVGFIIDNLFRIAGITKLDSYAGGYYIIL